MTHGDLTTVQYALLENPAPVSFSLSTVMKPSKVPNDGPSDSAPIGTMGVSLRL